MTAEQGTSMGNRNKTSRRAMVLLVVLVVVALLALTAGTFTRLMVAERAASGASVKRSQARALAESGLDMARMFVCMEKEVQDEYGSWYDNSYQFSARAVMGDEAAGTTGRFTIIAPLETIDGTPGLRYGLESESARLNLNAVLAFDELIPDSGRTLLMALPGMTEEIADCILDWMDPDDEPREYGAEFEYYTSLENPYEPKNGPLESIEELLLVRGIQDNPGLLLGVDTNRNRMIDLDEGDGQTVGGLDNADGAMTRGWASYLTLYSFEMNLNPEGQPKVNLNQDDMQTLYDELIQVLDEEQALFIIAYRLGTDYEESETTDAAAEPAEATPISEVDIDLSQEPQRTITSVFDLIGARVSMGTQTVVTEEEEEEESGAGGRGGGGGGQQQEEEQEVFVESPYTNDPMAMLGYLPGLLDYVSVVGAPKIMGRININQAPRLLLEGIPGMTPEIVDQIVAERIPDPIQALEVEGRDRETWILTEGLVTLEEMQAIYPLITAGGSVYRAQVIGYFDRGGPTVRLEAVFDTSTAPAAAQILFWRDITNLGKGYTQDILGGLGSGVVY